nr:uncharacterized protein [uncultured bacterium]
MAKARAYGADARLIAAVEASYGVAPATGVYRSLDFKSTDLSSEQKLGEDPLLGRGRNAQDPYRGLISDEGSIEIPLDVRGIGFWLNALLGASTTTPMAAASGTLTFSAQPADGSTITVIGVAFTFVDAAPGATDILIGADLAATLVATSAKLNASANPLVAMATYDKTATTITVVHDSPGAAGNTFTLAASASSNGTPSGATLVGGTSRHVFTSGAETLPSLTVEIGHPLLATPVFFRHTGTMVDSLDFDLGKEGAANATCKLVAQGEDSFSTSIDAAPEPFALTRFSQGKGYIKRGTSFLAGVTAGRFSFSNTLERVRTIRDDGKIDGADPTIATVKGSITLRFDGATLLAEAASGDPISLEYGFTSGSGHELSFLLPRVFLPKPKYKISGPGGVEAAFDWQAAYDQESDTMLVVTLVNDVVAY